MERKFIFLSDHCHTSAENEVRLFFFIFHAPAGSSNPALFLRDADQTGLNLTQHRISIKNIFYGKKTFCGPLPI